MLSKRPLNNTYFKFIILESVFVFYIKFAITTVSTYLNFPSLLPYSYHYQNLVLK